MLLLRRVYPACFAVWLAYRMVADAVGWRYDAARPSWGIVLAIITSVFPYAVMLVVASDAYMGRPIRIDRAIAHIARRVIAVYVVYVIRWAGILLGVICFVFPGVVFYFLTVMAESAVIFEDCPPVRALRRSEQLTREDLLRIALTLGSVMLVVALVQASLDGLAHVAAAHHWFPQPIQRVVRMLLGSVTGPFIPTVVAVLYYDLRIRREGLDLELMAQSL